MTVKLERQSKIGHWNEVFNHVTAGTVFPVGDRVIFEFTAESPMHIASNYRLSFSKDELGPWAERMLRHAHDSN